MSGKFPTNQRLLNALIRPLSEKVSYGSDRMYSDAGPYKRYNLYITKKKYNNLYFIAVAENPRSLEAKFKVKGNTPQDALNNLRTEIDKEIDVATKVSGQATLDFNVDFVRDILEMSTDPFYAKIIPGPKLVLAGPEMMEYPDIMRDEGFKVSSIRTYRGGEGTTKLPGVPLSPRAAMAANLIANGRYVLSTENTDKDGNKIFDLEFDSVVQSPTEKMRMRAPAFTVGTVREKSVAEGSLNEFAPGPKDGGEEPSGNDMDAAYAYIQKNYPSVKKYAVRRATTGFRAVDHPKYRDSGDPAGIDQAMVRTSLAHQTGVKDAIKYLQLQLNSNFSGSKDVSLTIGWSWYVFENLKTGIAVLYYADRGMGGDELVVAGKTPQIHAQAREVFRDAGVLPTPTPRKKQSVAEGAPNFDREWEEATRYPEFVKLGKEAWINLVSKGKSVTVTRKNVNKINNTDAADPESFKLLDPEKQKRALAQLDTGDVEMPIVARYSDGYLELIGGNTRLTAQMVKDGQAKVWLFNVPEESTQGVAEGNYEYQPPGASRAQTSQVLNKMKTSSNFVWKKPNQIGGSFSEQDLLSKGFKKSQYNSWGGTEAMWNNLVTRESAGTGVIASKKQAKDPRYSTSLTKDVRPGQISKNLKAFSLEESVVEDAEAAMANAIIKLIESQLK